ncbi:YggT family protein [Phenylobacterium sp.]|jgi:YggT family protein|uniref:YggT family protein n=1 Tax=Phenylobacterium sp. TaxID=1871053 RepID=UPI002F95D2D5
MVAIINFIFFILSSLLGLLIWAIIISAVLSWLVAFDVINLRNRFVYNVTRFLDAVTAPVLRPFRRFVPPLGGVDISPIIAILVLTGIQRYLLPAAHNGLLSLVAY